MKCSNILIKFSCGEMECLLWSVVPAALKPLRQRRCVCVCERERETHTHKIWRRKKERESERERAREIVSECVRDSE